MSFIDKERYNIVLEAQIKGISQITCGNTAKEADLICRKVILEKGYNFNHALGHGVGKEVHEKPVISPKNEEDILQNNMVFTIEPGIYLDEKFGVRIEDTVLLKDGKVESLNKVSKEITIIKG